MVVKAKEIRDGLFSISWTVQNISTCTTCTISQAISSQAEVDNLSLYFKSCILACKLEKNSLILEVKTKDASDTLKRAFVTASYVSVERKMKLNDVSIWRASWNRNSPSVQVPAGRPAQQQQALEERPSPANCLEHLEEIRRDPERTSERAQQTSYAISFDILIDVKPDCVLSVKKGTKKVLENFAKLFENKTMSDVTFKCGDNEFIKAHTCILASGSPVFAAMFQNDFKENRERIVFIEDIEVTILKGLFQYIYMGKCALLERARDQDESEVVDLLVAADKYAVDSLKEECESHLSQNITVDNAAKYLILAHLHNSQKLLESALNFMAKNAIDVCMLKDWMKIIKTYPELCFYATQVMVASCRCDSARQNSS